MPSVMRSHENKNKNSRQPKLRLPYGVLRSYILVSEDSALLLTVNCIFRTADRFYCSSVYPH